MTVRDQRREARAAAEHLIAVDPRLADVVRAGGLINPYVWPGLPLREGDLVAGLALHIVSQQITTGVALSMFQKLTALLGGTISARALAEATVDELRRAGLSVAKARALHELGERVARGSLSLESLRELDDAAAQAELVALRGIGPWSAQMFLLHELRRPDVFPAGDVGLRTALARLDGLDKAPDIKQAQQRAQIWSPYRSYAAAYLWTWPRQAQAGTHLLHS